MNLAIENILDSYRQEFLRIENEVNKLSSPFSDTDKEVISFVSGIWGLDDKAIDLIYSEYLTNSLHNIIIRSNLPIFMYSFLLEYYKNTLYGLTIRKDL